MLKITINRQEGTLVSYNGTPESLPAMFQYNVLPVQIQVVDPSGSISGDPYTVIDLSGKTLRVAITSTPTGTEGDTSPIVLQTSWTWNATNKWFTGSLDLNVTGVGTHIGTSAEKAANFEVTLIDGGDRSTLYQGSVTLKAAGDEGTAASLSPSEIYLNKAESDSRYVKRVMDNGGTIVIPDASGVYALEIKCNTDGTAGINVITL